MSDFRRRHLLAVLAGVSVLGMGSGGALAAPSKRRPKSMAKPTPALPMDKPKLVFLDPGHGGRDPGALGSRGTQEKTVVLAIARDLRRELLAGNRYRVLLSRTTDSYVPLRERVARAQAARADLFLSLHADAHGDRDVVSPRRTASG